VRPLALLMEEPMHSRRTKGMGVKNPNPTLTNNLTYLSRKRTALHVSCFEGSGGSAVGTWCIYSEAKRALILRVVALWLMSHFDDLLHMRDAVRT
jgi:hypothetical protein